MRALQQLTLALAVVLAVAWPSRGRAEPYLMVRSGAKCSDCHTNMTGGGMRTPFAHIHAHDILDDLDVLPIPPGVKPFNGQLNSYVSIGGDLRVANQTAFQDKPNAQGNVPLNRAFRSDVTTNTLSVIEALGYLNVDLWPDLLSFYLAENVTNGASTQEAFGLLKNFLPWGTYVKAGRLFPTYGLRVWDDQSFIRSRTGFTFQTPDDGGEIGITPGPFFLASSVTNGGSNDTDVLATVNGYGVWEDIPILRNVMAGGSFARVSNKLSEGCLYGGANLWKFTYLGEFDWIDNRTVATSGQNSRDQFAAYAEVDLLLLSWLNVRGTFDFVKVTHDRDQVRYTIGVNPFINNFLQPSIRYIINNGPNLTDSSGQPLGPALNTDVLWVELHLFL